MFPQRMRCINADTWRVVCPAGVLVVEMAVVVTVWFDPGEFVGVVPAIIGIVVVALLLFWVIPTVLAV